MSESRLVPPDLFPQWISRVKGGDAKASAEFVELYTPVLRRVARTILTQRRIGSLIDPLDICQTVFGRFFARAAFGWPRVDSLDQLTALMITMARNRARDELRRMDAVRRDHRRLEQNRTSLQLQQIEARELSPSQVFDYMELRDWVHSHLTSDERSLLEDRLAGCTWASIADEWGNPAEVLRKKLNRAIIRVRQRLCE